MTTQGSGQTTEPTCITIDKNLKRRIAIDNDLKLSIDVLPPRPHEYLPHRLYHRAYQVSVLQRQKHAIISIHMCKPDEQ